MAKQQASKAGDLIRRDYPNALGADTYKALIEDFGSNEKFIDFDYSRYVSANLKKEVEEEGVRTYLTPAPASLTIKELFSDKKINTEPFKNPAFHIDYARIRQEKIDNDEEVDDDTEEQREARIVN